MTLSDRAKALIYGFKNAERAVFFVNGDFKSIDPCGPRFERMMVDAPDRFVGIYNNNCTLEMIFDDINYASMTPDDIAYV